MIYRIRYTVCCRFKYNEPGKGVPPMPPALKNCPPLASTAPMAPMNAFWPHSFKVSEINGCEK